MKTRIYAAPAVKGLNIKICKYLVANSSNKSNFHPLEVVGRDEETQIQVTENLNK